METVTTRMSVFLGYYSSISSPYLFMVLSSIFIIFQFIRIDSCLGDGINLSMMKLNEITIIIKSVCCLTC
jgi:hypothetical protein